jgi:hypothetical protein
MLHALCFRTINKENDVSLGTEKKNGKTTNLTVNKFVHEGVCKPLEKRRFGRRERMDIWMDNEVNEP